MSDSMRITGHDGSVISRPDLTALTSQNHDSSIQGSLLNPRDYLEDPVIIRCIINAVAHSYGDWWRSLAPRDREAWGKIRTDVGRFQRVAEEVIGVIDAKTDFHTDLYDGILAKFEATIDVATRTAGTTTSQDSIGYRDVAASYGAQSQEPTRVQDATADPHQSQEVTPYHTAFAYSKLCKHAINFSRTVFSGEDGSGSSPVVPADVLPDLLHFFNTHPSGKSAIESSIRGLTDTFNWTREDVDEMEEEFARIESSALTLDEVEGVKRWKEEGKGYRSRLADVQGDTAMTVRNQIRQMETLRSNISDWQGRICDLRFQKVGY